MAKSASLFTFLLLTWIVSFGQEEPKFHFTIEHGAQQYSGEIGNGFYNFNQAYYDFLGFGLNTTIHKNWDLYFGWSKGDVGYQKSDYTSFLLEFTQIHFGLKGYLFSSDKIVRPYGSIAFGHNIFRANRLSSVESNSIPSLGLGIQIKLSQNLRLQFGERLLLTNYDKMDGQHGGRNDYLLQHHVGITISFGKPRDDDGDGIGNKNDKCPSIAGLKQYDGCLDSDEDGIPDYEDDCPNIRGITRLFGCPDFDGDGISDIEDECPKKKGEIKYKGCPDKDFDGTPDNIDDCPDTPGIFEQNGCPDLDNDGIPDHLDNCPTTKGLSKFNGCNDEDADGVPDNLDDCPRISGFKQFAGCPDSDGDGVHDKIDYCPNKAGSKAKNGCPEITSDEMKILLEALKGIQFDANESKLRPSSFDILNQVGNIMKRNPHYMLRIEGHTNIVGDDQFNLILSSTRASAVKTYLVNKGINSKRMTDVGFGNTKPKHFSANNTFLKKNDRVELIIEF